MGEVVVSVLTSSLDFDARFSVQSVVRELKRLADNLKGIRAPASVVWVTNSTKTDVSFGKVQKVISGKGFLQETINGYVYKIAPMSFFQTNSFMAGDLQKIVVNLAAGNSSDGEISIAVTHNLVFDLYAGAGFFSIPLAREFKRVIAIEENKDAVEIGQENFRLNNVDNVELIAGRTEDLISRYAQKLAGATVVVDPPRAGLHNKVVMELLKAKPRQIIYVSCKHTRFLYEFTKLGLGDFYKIESAYLIDQFPQTEHVEVVFNLIRKV